MTPREGLQQALEHHQAGRLSQAEHIYREILQADPRNPDALHYLGLMAHQLGQHDQAIDLIENAHRYRKPQPYSLNNLGMAYAAAGRFREAKRCFTKALAIRADYADAHSNLGSTLRALGELKDAEPSYRRALALEPSPRVHYNLGNLLMELGRLEEAEEQFRRALALDPHYVDALNNLGLLLAKLGRTPEAERTFRAAIAADPNHPQAHHNLGNLLKDTGRAKEAEQSYRAALASHPDLFETKVSLGNVLHRLGRFQEAASCHEEAIALQPSVASPHYNLGNSLASLDRWRDAATRYAKAIELEPDFGAARWALAMVQLPAVYESEAELNERRLAFAQQLDALSRWIGANASADGASVFVHQPFNLAYQEENNHDLLAQYGQLCKAVMERWGGKQRLAAPQPSRVGKVRFGIVSAHVHAHSVWHAIIKGWLQHLDRDQVETHVFHLGSSNDRETELAKAQAVHFDQGPRSLREWVDAILERQLDVLAFPEIGMNTLTAQLASLRLAPVQLASWGHPETSGIPTLDYYISGEAFESVDADRYYTEKLVRLPNLGCFYEPYETVPAIPDFVALRIPDDVPLLLCCGTPFKYAPSYDRLLTRIAMELGACRFVFFEDPHIPSTGKLRRRLVESFERAQLDFASYVVFLPWQPQAQFYGLMQRAAVFLDTVGFSGFNTAMQAMECGLPMVTMEGRFMRGRFGSAILKRMGLGEVVATSELAYVSLAVKLARELEYRNRIRRQIESSRQVLYGDPAPVRAFQEFLSTAGRRPSS